MLFIYFTILLEASSIVDTWLQVVIYKMEINYYIDSHFVYLGIWFGDGNKKTNKYVFSQISVIFPFVIFARRIYFASDEKFRPPHRRLIPPVLLSGRAAEFCWRTCLESRVCVYVNDFTIDYFISFYYIIHER